MDATVPPNVSLGYGYNFGLCDLTDDNLVAGNLPVC